MDNQVLLVVVSNLSITVEIGDLMECQVEERKRRGMVYLVESQTPSKYGKVVTKTAICGSRDNFVILNA